MVSMMGLGQTYILTTLRQTTSNTNTKRGLHLPDLQLFFPPGGVPRPVPTSGWVSEDRGTKRGWTELFAIPKARDRGILRGFGEGGSPMFENHLIAGLFQFVPFRYLIGPQHPGTIRSVCRVQDYCKGLNVTRDVSKTRCS